MKFTTNLKIAFKTIARLKTLNLERNKERNNRNNKEMKCRNKTTGYREITQRIKNGCYKTRLARIRLYTI